jgi:hypothetical protein
MNATRWEVYVVLADGRGSYLQVNGRDSWAKRSTAKRHADEYAARFGADTRSVTVRPA